MVLVIADWQEMKQYIQLYPMAEVFFKLDSRDSEKSRVRIMAGRMGWDQLIKDSDELESILKFLDERGAKAIISQRSDEAFFL